MHSMQMALRDVSRSDSAQCIPRRFKERFREVHSARRIPRRFKERFRAVHSLGPVAEPSTGESDKIAWIGLIEAAASMQLALPRRFKGAAAWCIHLDSA